MQTICSRHSIKFPFQALPVNNASLFTTLERFTFTPCHHFFTSATIRANNRYLVTLHLLSLVFCTLLQLLVHNHFRRVRLTMFASL